MKLSDIYSKKKSLLAVMDTLLQKYFTLADKIYTHSEIKKEELKKHFDPIICDDIIKLKKVYEKANLKRSCETPAFIHPLRGLMISKIIGGPINLQRVILGHDLLEDLPKNPTESENLIEKLPLDIRQNIIHLTNEYKQIMIKLSKVMKSQNLNSNNLDNINDSLDLLEKKYKSKRHQWVITSIRTRINKFSETCKIEEDETLIDAFRHETYILYIEDLFRDANIEKNTNIIMAKIIDRIDNTLSELAMKFEAQSRIFERNRLILFHTKQFLENNYDENLEFLYFLLIEISNYSLETIYDIYEKASKERGEFYGKQYNHLKERVKDGVDIYNQLFGEELKAYKKSKKLINYIEKLNE